MNFQFLVGIIVSFALCSIHAQGQCGGPLPAEGQCGGAVSEGQCGGVVSEGKCGGVVSEGQCGGAATEGKCGGDVEYTGMAATENSCEKETFLDMVGVGIPSGGCGGGGSYEDEPAGQCGSPGGSQDSDAGGNQGQCGAGGGGSEDEGTMYLSGIMASFYQQFEGLSEREAKNDFKKIIPNIDADKNKRITFDELYTWASKLIEEDASKIDLSVFDIMDMDKDKDKKISWDEYEAEQKKVLSKNEKTDYKAFAQGLKKEKIRFKYADVDKDGFIDTKELPRLVLHDNYIDMNDMAFDHAMIDYDHNNDGIISKKEFTETLSKDPTMYGDPEGNFGQFDKNGDNILSADEIQKLAMENTATPHIRVELKTIIALLDADMDGFLTYDELSDGYKYFTNPKEILPDDVLQAKYNDEYM